jgi:hypothetical protein
MEIVITLLKKKLDQPQWSGLQQVTFLCVQELAFLEPGADKIDACWNLCEQCYECLQLIFPEYCYIMGHHWYPHDHLKNVHTTHKPAFSSLPLYHMLLQAFVTSLKEICAAKQNCMFTCSSVANISKCEETIFYRKQTADTANDSIYDRTHSEVMSFMLPTPDTKISHAVFFH